MYISSKSTTRSWWCHRIRKSMTSVSAIFGIFQGLRRRALAFTSCTNGRRGWFLSLWGRRPARTSGSGPFNHNWNYSFFITGRPLPRSWRKWVRTHRWGRVGPTEPPIGILDKVIKIGAIIDPILAIFLQPVFNLEWTDPIFLRHIYITYIWSTETPIHWINKST